MEYKTIQKFVRVSPRKLRLVVSMIKDLSPSQAITRLPFSGKSAGLPLRKAILTAIANAKQKNVNSDDLIFKEIQINEGPRLKRWRAGARGRAKPYRREMSHIRVVLVTKEPDVIRKSREAIMKNKELKKESKVNLVKKVLKASEKIINDKKIKMIEKGEK